MAQVYGYKEQDNDFRLFSSEVDWEKQLTVNGVKRYLKDHLRNQLVRELPLAIDAFKKASNATRVGTGFWGLARMVFAPVSFLGALYKGSDSTDNAIDFLEEYIGRRQNRQAYLDLSAPIFVMYRHGLIHTAMPKVIERDDGVIVGWGVTLNPQEHLTKKIAAKSITLLLSPEQLYQDLVQAIDSYAGDFDGPQQTQLFDAFKSGFLTMATINRVHAVKKMSRVSAKKVTRSLNTL